MQSHAARTQDTLVDAVENAAKSPKSSAQCFAHLTRLRVTEMKEFDTIARLETQTTDDNNETFRRETVSHEFRTACLIPRKRTSGSTLFSTALIPLSLVVKSTVRGVAFGRTFERATARGLCHGRFRLQRKAISDKTATEKAESENVVAESVSDSRYCQRKQWLRRPQRRR